MKCPNCDIELIHRPIDPPDSLHCPKCVFITFPNDRKADYLYAALSVDENGKEGILCTHIASMNMAMAMVSIRKELLDTMVTKEFIESIKRCGHDVTIGKFKRVEDEKNKDGIRF